MINQRFYGIQTLYQEREQLQIKDGGVDSLIAASTLLELIGPLKADVFTAGKYLPSGVSIKIKLTKSAPAFHFWCSTGVTDK